MCDAKHMLLDLIRENRRLKDKLEVSYVLIKRAYRGAEGLGLKWSENERFVKELINDVIEYLEEFNPYEKGE